MDHFKKVAGENTEYIILNTHKFQIILAEFSWLVVQKRKKYIAECGR